MRLLAMIGRSPANLFETRLCMGKLVVSEDDGASVDAGEGILRMGALRAALQAI